MAHDARAWKGSDGKFHVYSLRRTTTHKQYIKKAHEESDRARSSRPGSDLRVKTTCTLEDSQRASVCGVESGALTLRECSAKHVECEKLALP